MVRYRLSRQNERRLEIVKTAKLPGFNWVGILVSISIRLRRHSAAQL